MNKLLIHFSRYGPYHMARLRSARDVLQANDWLVEGLETAGNDSVYDWSVRDAQSSNESEPKVHTALVGKIYEDSAEREIRSQVLRVLDEVRPSAVAIAGWASIDARTCLKWCGRNGATAILMSETRAADGKRVWWKEWIKSRIVRRFDGALVGGASHRDYLSGLGMNPQRIRSGYNVVDNRYFAESANEQRKVSGPHDPPFFLASNRFVARKNLARLVEGFARYGQQARASSSHVPWNLCLLGDGEERESLIRACTSEGLRVKCGAPWEEDRPDSPTVFFPGFRQIEELPTFFGRSSCFVHPALEEPWGLVINEAMASGLPILSSRNVGAAEELLEEGTNGWTFDPLSVDSIMEGLLSVASAAPEVRDGLGSASVELLEQRYPTKAFGTGLLALLRGSSGLTRTT